MDSKWNSRKLAVAALGILSVALNKRLQLGLDDTDIKSIFGIVASFVAGQGLVDVMEAKAEAQK